MKEESKTGSWSQYLPSQISKADIEFMLLATLFGVYTGTLCLEQEEEYICSTSVNNRLINCMLIMYEAIYFW